MIKSVDEECNKECLMKSVLCSVNDKEYVMKSVLCSVVVKGT